MAVCALIIAIGLAAPLGTLAKSKTDDARTGVLPGPGPASPVVLQWEHKVDSVEVTGPVLAGEKLVFAEPENDNGYYLAALDIRTGKEAWRVETPTPIEAPVTFADGVIYAMGSTGFGDDAFLEAVDPSTGDTIWQTPITGSVSYTTASPSVLGDTLFYSTDDGLLVAVNIAGGEELWEFSSADSEPLTSPTASGGYVYVVGSKYLYALDAATGEERWRQSSGYDVDAAPMVMDNKIFVAGARASRHLKAYDVHTGSELWTFEGPEDFGAPAGAGGLVYVTSGQLVALDAETGAKVWSADGGSTPAIANGVLYLADGSGKVRALDSKTGDEVWTYSISAWEAEPAVVADGVVFVLTSDNYSTSMISALATGGGDPCGDGYASDPEGLKAGGLAVTVQESTQLRSAPSTSSLIAVELPSCTEVTPDQLEHRGGAAWWHVTVVSTGQEGFVQADEIRAVIPPGGA